MKNFEDYLVEMEEIQDRDLEVYDEGFFDLNLFNQFQTILLGSMWCFAAWNFFSFGVKEIKDEKKSKELRELIFGKKGEENQNIINAINAIATKLHFKQEEARFLNSWEDIKSKLKDNEIKTFVNAQLKIIAKERKESWLNILKNTLSKMYIHIKSFFPNFNWKFSKDIKEIKKPTT
jgi:hypothetical protein